MQLKILALGRRMPDWVNTAFADYHKRFPPQFSLTLHELNVEKRTKNNDIPTLLQKEAKQITEHLSPGDYLVVLDEHGTEWSTMALAEKLQRWHDENLSVVLVIGGPDGLADSIKKQAQQLWSLSKLTLPHPLVRVVLIEQFYRAISILNNHPYHRE